MFRTIPPFVAILTIASPLAAQPVQSDSRMLSQLAAADANRDGAVTRAEFLAFRAQQFARFDRNRDGALTSDDIPPFAVRSGLAPDFSTLQATFDKNGDGRISRDEFVNGPTPVFDAVDANKDNILSRDEREAALAAARRSR